MFQPKYTITDRLLSNIKRINTLVNELNDKRFPHVVLLEFEKVARAVSTYASTSIKGNPLPLTEVKKILKLKPEHIRDSEKEVLNYNHALQDLNEKLEKEQIRLTLALILKTMNRLQRNYYLNLNLKIKRQTRVVNDPRTRKVIYLPPDTKDVRKLLEDLIKFINSNKDKIDPLILAGIFHK